MNNKLSEIQKIIFKQIERLDKISDVSEVNNEVSRANALSQNATVYLKTINIGIRAIEIAERYNIDRENLQKDLGILNEK